MANVFSTVASPTPSTNASNFVLRAPAFPAAGDIWVTRITKAECLGRVISIVPLAASGVHLNNWGRLTVTAAGTIVLLDGGSGIVANAALNTANKANVGFTTLDGVEYLSVGLLGTQYQGSGVANVEGSMILSFEV
jgi:hypothetical protein